MTKKETNIAKGIAVILLLIHHLFLPSNNPALHTYGLTYDVLGEAALTGLADFSKVCVSIFTFLSGYGTVKSYISKKLPTASPAMTSYTIQRFVSVLVSFQFVFLLAVLFQFVGSRMLPLSSIQPLSSVYGAVSRESLVFLGIDFFGMSYLMHTPTLNGTWWYMSLAYCVVILIPLFALCYQKTGLLFVVPVFFLSRILELDPSYGVYLPVAALGAALAYRDPFEKAAAAFGSGSAGKRAWLLGLSLIITALTAVMRWVTKELPQLWSITDSGFVIALCMVILLGITKIPLLSHILAWIGTHSMNIFLTHTLLYHFWFPEHILSFRYPGCILLVLLSEALLLSVIITILKKKLRISELSDWISLFLARQYAPCEIPTKSL